MSQRHHHQDEPGRERGFATTMILVLSIAIFTAAGLSFDGVRIMSYRRAAQEEAAASARVVGQFFDEGGLRGGDPFVSDRQDEAKTAALTLIDEAGYDSSLALIEFSPTGDQVRVTVREVVPMLILGVIGVPDRTVTGTATIVLVQGM
jgi:hypothetical protein